MTQVPLTELYIQIETETLPVLWMKQTNWPMPPRIAATLRLGLERKAIVVRVGVAGSAWQLAAPLREQVLVPVRWFTYHASHPLAKQHPILNLIMPIPTLLRMATNRKIETTKLDWPWRSFSHPTINTKKCNFSLFSLTFFLSFWIITVITVFIYWWHSSAREVVFGQNAPLMEHFIQRLQLGVLKSYSSRTNFHNFIHEAISQFEKDMNRLVNAPRCTETPACSMIMSSSFSTSNRRQMARRFMTNWESIVTDTDTKLTRLWEQRTYKKRIACLYQICFVLF